MPTFDRPVLFEDIGTGEVVYKIKYLKLFERACNRYSGLPSFEQDELEILKTTTVVRNINVDFIELAIFNVVAIVTTKFIELMKARFLFNQEIFSTQGGQNKLFNCALENEVCVTGHFFKSTLMPSEIVEKLNPYL